MCNIQGNALNINIIQTKISEDQSQASHIVEMYQWRQNHGTEQNASLLYIHIICKANVT